MSYFERLAQLVSRWTSHPFSFLGACLLIIGWAVLGPVFDYSDTWQLVINTSTTIITFLMVFLIQNTQSRESRALHLKIDELVRALDAADTNLIDLERRSQKELETLEEKYVEIAEEAKHKEGQEGDPPAL